MLFWLTFLYPLDIEGFIFDQQNKALPLDSRRPNLNVRRVDYIFIIAKDECQFETLYSVLPKRSGKVFIHESVSTKFSVLLC